MADDESDGSDSLDEHDIEALRATQEEARAVLDHQIETVRSVDDKAARTFRLDAILLGLILTAVSFLARTDSVSVHPFINPITILGVISLIISFVFAVATFTVTDIQTGLGSGDIQRLIDKKYSERDWLILLLRSEAAWMKWNEEQQSLNGALLTVSHGSLIFAVVCVSIGISVPLLPL